MKSSAIILCATIIISGEIFSMHHDSRCVSEDFRFFERQIFNQSWKIGDFTKRWDFPIDGGHIFCQYNGFQVKPSNNEQGHAACQGTRVLKIQKAENSYRDKIKVLCPSKNID